MLLYLNFCYLNTHIVIERSAAIEATRVYIEDAIVRTTTGVDSRRLIKQQEVDVYERMSPEEVPLQEFDSCCAKQK